MTKGMSLSAQRASIRFLVSLELARTRWNDADKIVKRLALSLLKLILFVLLPEANTSRVQRSDRRLAL